MGDQNSSVTRRLAYIIVRCVFYSSARGFRHAYRATQADHPRSVFCAVITDRASSVTLTLPGVIVNVIAVAIIFPVTRQSHRLGPIVRLAFPTS